jgi:hypothetical protein
MRNITDTATLDELCRLLVNPLLINYPGSVKKYIEDQKEKSSGKTRQFLLEALEKIDKYHEELHNVPTLHALHPLQSQRESHYRLQSGRMRESMKEAMKQSIVQKICHSSILLYGNSAINYIHFSNEKSQRMENKLVSHSVSFEMPSMEYIAPFDLNYMLRVFRAER